LAAPDPTSHPYHLGLVRSSRFSANRRCLGDFDPFGDFDLIFGAARQNLKVVEIPVRYQARTYGETNIRRFRHGRLLLRMSWLAFRKITWLRPV
jgi:hypothetical protein